MSAGTEFLAVVMEKLRGRIRELDETIEFVQKDIEGMHEYYWENYTEMDQYGYENFDNSQALLTQINANQENLNMRRRLKRMLDSPFFGRVDFIYDGDDEAETFHIGIGNFSEKRGGIPLIYDWRAPVSGLFYDYDRGPASYEAPSGRLHGEISSKWQYKIRGGRMIYEFESDMKIDDDILKQELGTNSDTQLKNIVRTIQKEQNAIIRNTKDQVLVIQGAAACAEGDLTADEAAARNFRCVRSLLAQRLSPIGSPCGQAACSCACDGRDCCCAAGLLSTLAQNNLSRRVSLAAGLLVLQDVALLGTVGNVLVLSNDCDNRLYFVCVNSVQFIG